MDFDCVRFGGFFSAVMFSFCEDKIAGNRSIKAKKKRGRCACVYVCDVCGGYRL